MRRILIYFILTVISTSCQPVSLEDQSPYLAAVTPHVSKNDQVETVSSVPTQITLSQPTLESSVSTGTEKLWEGDQMPVFLEVTQTVIMRESSVQSPATSVGPAIYFYNAGSKILLLHSTITLNPTTELLIGITSILQTPDQVYEKREIVQFPSAQPALVQIASFDAGTDTPTILYGDEKFDLSPGESRTFKQVGSGSNTLTIFTMISNHGRLKGIQPVPSDGSWR